VLTGLERFIWMRRDSAAYASNPGETKTNDELTRKAAKRRRNFILTLL
jgi:hypothetical protein